MDGSRFDELIQKLTGSRRSLVGGTLALATGLLGLAETEARKKRRRKRKHKPKPKAEPKPEPNEYGCLDVGQACTSEDQCCSGICEGKKGKRTCKAHDVGSCSAGAQIENCGGTNVSCTTSSGGPGLCGTTTGNAGYCLATAYAVACKTDTDCQEASGGILGPDAACLRCPGIPGTGGTICAIPFQPPVLSLDGLLD